MPRSIYVSTACTAHLFSDLESQINAYLRAGLSRIELGFGPRSHSSEYVRWLPASVKAWLVHNYFPPEGEPLVLNLASSDENIHCRSIEFCRRSIDLSALLGASFYSVHAGFRADFTPASLGRVLQYKEIAPYEDAWTCFTDAIRELLEFARQRRLDLLVEMQVLTSSNLIKGRNELLLLVEMEEWTRLFSEISDPALGILLDTGHFRVNQCTLGFNHEAFLAAIGPRLGAFHLHDNNGMEDQHRPVTDESWAVELIDRPQFGRLPVIVEANFDSVEALAHHTKWLMTRLN